MQKLNLNYFHIAFLLLLSTTSCVTHSELLNFSQGEPFPDQPETISELPQLKIQPDDLISIKVHALEEPAAAIPYNIDPLNANVNNLGGSNVRPLIGYLVDRDGFITFPVLGRLYIGGMTTTGVENLIIGLLKPDELKDPMVSVRLINFRITVLGEVSNPGTFSVATERITILDALGLAGDLQPYANRTNILITREQNGERFFGRINLQDRNIFESDFFYLKQNDFVYVEPLPERTASLRDQTQRLLPYISAGITVITFILTLTNLRN
ncbi:polysaccharide biosynthesis/export family protein [Flavilitoribacter nigricans]|uniref:Sugar transporter n=1 Tax=Flavilitoribacter nigricans (strain ATCC 23147 / DSM 23189 / NBRC 102662 / NCIMB 1420 / SS-2) TaxID=1122177 RepID=A0A2D0MZ57_FLAN2|nr:polysaccharide biosynthesis/export family protein [Flavilitoribacter nigricans]PHN01507.1 sugar transporter [Flavilitoribacter nigricans DSM 23189 = NBRC 102662]